MRCLIFLNAKKPGEICDKRFYVKMSERAEKIICADGGLDLALSLDIKPDIVIGDMDSVENTDALRNTEIIKYPTEKDRTDGWLALRKAIKMGCEEIIITNAISETIDHTLSNIHMMISVPENIKVRISEPDVDVYLLRSGMLVLEGRAGDRVSLIPASNKVEGLRIKGMKYPMSGEFLRFGETLGLSNIMLSRKSTIKMEKGVLIVIHYRSFQF